MGAHHFTLLWCGSDHYRRGIFEGASGQVWVKEAGGGDLETICIEDGGLEVDEQTLRVVRKGAKG